MSAAYAVLLGLCLLGLSIRAAYEHLKEAGRVDTESATVLALVSAGMGLFLLSWPFLGPLDPLRIALPGAIRWAGLLGLVAGLALAIGGLLQLRGLENIDHLVTGGLYAKLRHPMYTGFMLWILGWVILYGAAASLALALLGIANILHWRRLEERRLGSQFGEAYLEYKKGSWF